MKKFDVLKAITDEERHCDMTIRFNIEVKENFTIGRISEEECCEKELLHSKEAALNGYPLFLSGIQ